MRPPRWPEAGSSRPTKSLLRRPTRSRRIFQVERRPPGIHNNNKRQQQHVLRWPILILRRRSLSSRRLLTYDLVLVAMLPWAISSCRNNNNNNNNDNNSNNNNNSLMVPGWIEDLADIMEGQQVRWVLPVTPMHLLPCLHRHELPKPTGMTRRWW